MIGEGEAIYKEEKLSGGEALKRADITPVALEAKEGLSLLNGTQGMLSLLSMALREADMLADTADVAAALSLDALRGSPGAFDARVMHARAYSGAATTARNLAHLNDGSQIRESHRSPEADKRVQDAYSLRCTPQVHGAVRDSLLQAREVALVELNSATDNPLVFTKEGGGGDIISGGNFHGQPLAMAADQVAIAVATLGGIAERRVEQMTNPLTSMLPAFLTPDPGAEFWLYDCTSDCGRAYQRKSRAGHAAFRGFHFDFGKPGGLRFHGYERGAQVGSHAAEFAEYFGD